VRRAAAAARRLAAWVRRLGTRDATPIDALLQPGFVAIDLETTGLDARRDAIVAVAAIPFAAGRPGPGYVSLVDPARPIPPASTRVHGIDDARVAGAPRLDAALARFDAACRGRVLVGHEVAFDLAVLARARRLRRLPPPEIVAFDTRRLAIALHPRWRRHATLEELAAALGIPVVGRHTADGDARLAGQILVALLPEFRRRGVETLGALAWAQTALYRRA
jgi:DNA polymerase-3 subunit epsilon/CBS domain-containing protein